MNKKYKYYFSVNNYDYSVDTIFLSDIKYSNLEFIKICTNIIYNLVINYISNIEIEEMYIEDEESFNILTKKSTIRNSLYTNFDFFEKEFEINMNKKGFYKETAPKIEASCNIDNYDFIIKNFGNEIHNILKTRSKLENIQNIT